jgi:XTP/dITP diphosphohydrolase
MKNSTDHSGEIPGHIPSVSSYSELSKLLLATTNRGKIRELSELLSELPVELLGLEDMGALEGVEESGSTFSENASLKASAYALQTGFYTLADDSGLEVIALGNAPGVLSARYAGENTPFDEKIKRLLAELAIVPEASREARFVCAMSLANPTGEIIFTAEGDCIGALASKPRGTSGFGYDPIFIPIGYDRTFGELENSIKKQISHRARAAAKIIRYLHGFFAV